MKKHKTQKNDIKGNQKGKFLTTKKTSHVSFQIRTHNTQHKNTQFRNTCQCGTVKPLFCFCLCVLFYFFSFHCEQTTNKRKKKTNKNSIPSYSTCSSISTAKRPEGVVTNETGFYVCIVSK